MSVATAETLAAPHIFERPRPAELGSSNWESPDGGRLSSGSDASTRGETEGLTSTQLSPAPSPTSVATPSSAIEPPAFPAVRSPSASSAMRRIRVFLMRHAHSTINELGSDATYDPPLSEQGRLQAKTAGRNLAEVVDPHVVITSPLSRALETADRVFGTYLHFEIGDVAPVIVREEAREIVGSKCHGEFRRPRSTLSTEYPTFDFSSIHEDDLLAGSDSNESLAALRTRARLLLHRQVFHAGGTDLSTLFGGEEMIPQELRVAVISHYHCIRATLHEAFAGGSVSEFADISDRVKAFVEGGSGSSDSALLPNCRAISLRLTVDSNTGAYTIDGADFVQP